MSSRRQEYEKKKIATTFLLPIKLRNLTQKFVKFSKSLQIHCLRRIYRRKKLRKGHSTKQCSFF